MATCAVCGNDYDRTMEIAIEGSSYVFDSFECAIHLLAPTCDHCGCRILGHGMQADGTFYCCAHCAHQAGIVQLTDRA